MVLLIAAQAVLVAVLPLSTTAGVLLFNLFTAAVGLLLQLLITLGGFTRPGWVQWMKSTVPRRLNLGCGLKKRPDAVNVDLRPAWSRTWCGTWTSAPIRCRAAISSTSGRSTWWSTWRTSRGSWRRPTRCSRPAGILEITTPHFSCANSFTDPDAPAPPGLLLLRLLHRRLAVERSTRRVRFEIARAHRWCSTTSRPDRLMSRWANRRPAVVRAAARPGCWPAWFLIFKLRAVK